jgi:hypothetical protein
MAGSYGREALASTDALYVCCDRGDRIAGLPGSALGADPDPGRAGCPGNGAD